MGSSLESILGSANSGLQAAQAQLRVVSDNIANVNTPGYARKVIDQTPVTLSDMGGGVDTGRVTLSVDQFLRQASLTANATAAGANTVSDMLDRAQTLFGDPSTTTGYFNQLDQAFSAFSTAATDPASTVSRNQALDAINNFLNQSSSISSQLSGFSQEADSRIGDNVSQVNSLLSQIDVLNKSIVRDTAAGGDSSGAEDSQSQLIDQLSAITDVSVYRRPDGGVDLRGGGGLLISQAGAATLSFATAGPTAGEILSAAPGGGTPRPLQPTDGVLKGLADLRNVQIPAIQAQLGEYVSRAVDAINSAHNASSAVPPPATLTGRNTGLDLPTAVSGFTGKTTVAVVNSAGVLQSRVDIDFDAGTMTTDGGSPASFTASTFLDTLNTALGSNGSASFNNGSLSLQASSGNGISIADDATTPSNKAGRGFSQFFGLNDLITSSGFPDPATGLQGSDLNGFNAGGVITLRLKDASGAPIRDAAVTVPAGGTMDDLVTALNSTSTGVGLYGAYSLDSNGELTFAPSQPGVSVDVVSDTTQRGAGGPSMSALFGLDPSLRAQRASTFSVRSDIAADSMKLSLAQFDPTATAGQLALSVGDGRGADLLSAVGDNSITFDPAGGFGALTMNLSQYGAQFAGTVAAQSAAATANSTNAQSVSTEAQARRSSVEGVNLDEELVNLTTYQQSYNASARVIQAAANLFDILLKLD